MNDKQDIMVEIWLPRCPKCDSVDLQHYGTRKTARGATVRYYRCRNPDCRARFPARVMNADDEDTGKEFDMPGQGD